MSEPGYDDDNPIIRGDKEIEEPAYLTDAISEEAASFIDDHADKPFCLVVSYGAVHSPMQAKTEDIKAMRRIKDVQRRIFAGMLLSLDRGVGMLRDQLEKHSLTRQTMVVFVSDNGGPTEELTSSNAPLRGGKGSVYEGGIRVPMVWSYPGKIPAGRTEDRPVLSLDIAATALDVAGLPPVENADGRSLLEWVDDPSLDHPHDVLFWRMSGGKLACRVGNWKVVKPKKGEPFELYHLAGDPTESRNLATEHPIKMRELINKLTAMESEMPAPIVLPRAEPKKPGSKKKQQPKALSPN
jgi:arylsulfatase B